MPRGRGAKDEQAASADRAAMMYKLGLGKKQSARPCTPKWRELPLDVVTDAFGICAHSGFGEADEVKLREGFAAIDRDGDGSIDFNEHASRDRTQDSLNRSLCR